MRILKSLPRILPASLVTAVALLDSACSLGHNMKTVETAPKGETRPTVGASIWFTRDDAFQAGTLEENNSVVVFGPLFFMRYGLTDRAEVGVSLDGVYWPGVGGKVRVNDWMALDANMKLTMPVWENNPPMRPFFDAAMIFGDTAHSFGLKLLSRGVMPGTAGRSDPDAVLFYGYKRGFIFPEVAYMLRHREISFGVGFAL